MKIYQKKLNQDLHYKFLFSFPCFKNPIFKIVILQNIKLKTIKDISVIQALTLSENLFSCRPKIQISHIKYRFKENFVLATLQLIFYNNNLKNFLILFLNIYYPNLKKIFKLLRYKKLLYYFSKNNIITFLFNFKLFGFIKTELNKNLKNPFLIKIFIKNGFFKEYKKIFSIFVLSRFIKFPIRNYIMRRKINKDKKLCKLKNILKII